MVRTAASDPFSYLTDEGQISQKLGFEVPYPVRVFSLEGLGINQKRFIRELAPTFSILKWDQYDVKRGQVSVLKGYYPEQEKRLDRFLADYYADKATLYDVADLVTRMSLESRWKMERVRPRRKRAIAKFAFTRSQLSQGRSDSWWWSAERVPSQSFSQSAPSEAGDVRALVRIFDEASDDVVTCIRSRGFLYRLLEMVRAVRPGVQELTMTMHQVSIFAELEHDGDNAPEGVHQDGSDYIVSALVVERDGILGGESIVYGPDKKTEYLRHTLMPGQGIFQADKNTPLWHYVTSILEDPNVPPTYGKRSILGFDVDVTKEN